MFSVEYTKSIGFFQAVNNDEKMGVHFFYHLKVSFCGDIYTKMFMLKEWTNETKFVELQNIIPDTIRK